MDTSTFRWVLIVIAIMIGIGVYLYGVHQARLRKRSAVETLTREEVDSAFVEDEQLRLAERVFRDHAARAMVRW